MKTIQPDDARLSALAEFAAGAGHEINNPVASIVGYARSLLADEADPERRQMLAAIAAQGLRIRDMIGDVMLFARPPQPTFVVCDLVALARQAVAGVAEQAARSNVQLVLSGSDPVLIRADREQAAIVLAELLRNACESGATQLTIEISGLAGSGLLEVPHGLLCVTDNGRGMSDLERTHLFDPFFSGRQSGRGLGFGLCKCWQIVRSHAGRLSCEVSPGLTRFLVAWPSEPG